MNNLIKDDESYLQKMNALQSKISILVFRREIQADDQWIKDRESLARVLGLRGHTPEFNKYHDTLKEELKNNGFIKINGNKLDAYVKNRAIHFSYDDVLIIEESLGEKIHRCPRDWIIAEYDLTKALNVRVSNPVFRGLLKEVYSHLKKGNKLVLGGKTLKAYKSWAGGTGFAPEDIPYLKNELDNRLGIFPENWIVGGKIPLAKAIEISPRDKEFLKLYEEIITKMGKGETVSFRGESLDAYQRPFGNKTWGFSKEDIDILREEIKHRKSDLNISSSKHDNLKMPPIQPKSIKPDSNDLKRTGRNLDKK